MGVSDHLHLPNYFVEQNGRYLPTTPALADYLS